MRLPLFALLHCDPVEPPDWRVAPLRSARGGHCASRTARAGRSSGLCEQRPLMTVRANGSARSACAVRVRPRPAAAAAISAAAVGGGTEGSTALFLSLSSLSFDRAASAPPLPIDALR